MTVKVHLPEMFSKNQLQKHPKNSNKQSKFTFKELRTSIRENGFDESLLIVPQADNPEMYWIVAGNHRFDAGVAEGMKEFPCVVREDWDDVKEQVELVRRNYVRGDIDKEAFTAAVDSLAYNQHLSVDEVREMMGFEGLEEFMDLYQEQEDEKQRLATQVNEEQRRSAPAVKMIDDLGLVLSSIFDKYGDTVPSSFIVFPAGGKEHVFIAATPAIVSAIQEIAHYSISNHMDINVVLGGILAIGKHNSHLGNKSASKEEIADEGNSKEGPESFDYGVMVEGEDE